MPTKDEMTVTERRKFLKKMKPLYLKAQRSEQSRMLTEMERVTVYTEKASSGCFMPPHWNAKSARKAEDVPMD